MKSSNAPIPDAIKPTVKLAKGRRPVRYDAGDVGERYRQHRSQDRPAFVSPAASPRPTTRRSTAPSPPRTSQLTVSVPSSATLGSTVNIRAIAIDGATNTSDTAHLVMTVGNLEPPQAVVTSPAAGSPVVSGKSLVLSLSARARYKVRILGYQLSGAYNARDSVVYGAPLQGLRGHARHAVRPRYRQRAHRSRSRRSSSTRSISACWASPVSYAVQSATQLQHRCPWCRPASRSASR